MIITIDASPATLAVLDAAGIRYEVTDKDQARVGELEKLKKFKPGSVKFLACQARIKALEEACAGPTGCPKASAFGKERSDLSAGCAGGEPASMSTTTDGSGLKKSSFSPKESDAVNVLVQLQNCTRSAAEKAVLRASGDTADQLALDAMRYLKRDDHPNWISIKRAIEAAQGVDK